MNTKIYLAAGSLAILAIVAVAAISIIQPTGFNNSPAMPSDTVSELPDQAFGNLAALSPAPSGAGLGAGAEVSSRSVAFGLGGSAMMTEQAADVSASDDIKPNIEPINSKMILPYYSFNYKYAGDVIELSDTQGKVYRRIKGDGQSGRALASVVQNLDFPGIDLSNFSNLRAFNLSLVEDKDMGLMVSFDFNEDTVYISEFWEKWRITEREACAGDQACWDRWRLKPSDVPADSELVSLADNFLNKLNVNREHYGNPQVDNGWRIMYERSSDAANFYIPEYATVIYPLLIDGEPARDQSGSYAGLRVTINLLKKAASGLSGLSPYRYQNSSYNLETSSERIIQAAEKGGWNGAWFGGSENKTLELGTPQKVYVQLWRYENGHNDELFVPALLFNVTNPPDDLYYGQRSVIVPLVKDMLDEILNRQDPRPMPMPADGEEPIQIMIKGEENTSVPEADDVEISPMMLNESR